MIGSIYTGLSGLMAYSEGLDVVSNNVSNLNTPGFKGKDLQFQDLFYQYESQENGQNNPDASVGSGVEAKNTTTRFLQGEIRSTGNNLDIAIQGSGMLVLKQDQALYYSRAGELEFDKNGYLVSRGSDARLMFLDAQGSASVAGGTTPGATDGQGQLHDFNISGFRTMAPKATAEVKLVGNISAAVVRKEIDNIEIYDASGNIHKLKVILVKKTADTPQWTIAVMDENGKEIAKDGEIHFNAAGMPEENFNQFSFSYQPEKGAASEIRLNFGDPNSVSGTTSRLIGENADIKLDKQDGYALGSLIDIKYGREGELTLVYSNGEKSKQASLALAWANNLQSFQQVGGNRYQIRDSQDIYYATATQQGMGEIVEKSVELSNVELMQEFTDMIIIQRGYQASSQVITTANEMMQQAIDMVRKR